MRPRILFVDDFADYIELQSMNFRDAPFDCDFAESGERLLELARAKRYDLIISDLAMYPLSGWEALEAIREEQPSTPLWALSTYSELDPMNKARAERIQARLLQKLDTPANLKGMISRFLGLE